MSSSSRSVPEIAGRKRGVSVHLATSRLRDAILEGRFQPGEQLVERRIAAELALSNIVVREAFAALADEGIVVRLAGRGAFVRPVSVESVRDLSIVRTTMEQLVVKLALPRWSERDQAQAQATLEAMGDAAGTRNVRALLDLDQQFHAHFWAASGSDTLQRIAWRLSGQTVLFIREALAHIDPGELPGIVALHQRWLDDVESGELERALATVEHHIDNTAEVIIQALESNDGRTRRIERLYRTFSDSGSRLT